MLETKRTSPIIAVDRRRCAPVERACVWPRLPLRPPAPAAAARPPHPRRRLQPTRLGKPPRTLKVGGSANGKLTPFVMFMQADLVVKIVMIGLLACSLLSWTLLIIKLFEFATLSRTSDRFLEIFRGAKSINDMGKIAESEEFAGNPLADMAAAAAAEVELSRQAGLQRRRRAPRLHHRCAPRRAIERGAGLAGAAPFRRHAVPGLGRAPTPRSSACSAPSTGS